MAMPVTWRYMKEWAAANNVPDNAEIVDYDGRAVTDLSSDPEGPAFELILEGQDQ